MWQKFRRVAACVALATSALYAVFLYTQISGLPSEAPRLVVVTGVAGGVIFFATAFFALFVMGGGGRWEHQILVLLIALLSLPLLVFIGGRSVRTELFVRDGALLWQFATMLLVLLDFVLSRGTSVLWEWRKRQAGYVIAGFLTVLVVTVVPRLMPDAKAPTGTMSVVLKERQPTVVCPRGTEAVVVSNRRSDGEAVSIEARRLSSRRSKTLTWWDRGSCPPPTVLQVFPDYSVLPLCVSRVFWNTACQSGSGAARRAGLPLEWKPLEWKSREWQNVMVR